MNVHLKSIYEKVRLTMLDFEEIDKVISSIEDTDLINVKVKERLKEYCNTCLSDLLIFSDVIYQIWELADCDEMDMILDILRNDGDDDG